MSKLENVSLKELIFMNVFFCLFSFLFEKDMQPFFFLFYPGLSVLGNWAVLVCSVHSDICECPDDDFVIAWKLHSGIFRWG